MQFHYQNTALVSEQEIVTTAQSLQDYVLHLQDVVKQQSYTADESSINLPSDEELLDMVQKLSVKKKTDNLKYMVVVGIGGSNLGTKAIYDALFGYYDLLEPNRFPKMIFLDTQDDAVLHHLQSLIKTLNSKDEILINAISKSGGTTETMTNLEVLSSFFEKRFGSSEDRIVFTTDKGSKMHQKALELKIDTLTLPVKVGGRYSVLSAVGLFPLSVCGIDITNLRSGAVKMRDICVNYDIKNNPALLSAAISFLHSQKKRNINNHFFFAPQLESLGKWYRQLMGESIGKEGKGITPMVSIGSTDLHSVGQLYLGGPKDKLTTFVYNTHPLHEVIVANIMKFGLVEAIKNMPVSRIVRAIVEGTKIAYHKQRLPFVEIVLDRVGERELGAFLQYKMIEMMYLGKFFGVNAFDQPHVELYKTETKHILVQGR